MLSEKTLAEDLFDEKVELLRGNWQHSKSRWYFFRIFIGVKNVICLSRNHKIGFLFIFS